MIYNIINLKQTLQTFQRTIIRHVLDQIYEQRVIVLLLLMEVSK